MHDQTWALERELRIYKDVVHVLENEHLFMASLASTSENKNKNELIEASRARVIKVLERIR